LELKMSATRRKYAKPINIQIGHRAHHDFTEPLGLLRDCHRRIEHFLRILVAIEAGAAGRPLTPSDRSALQGAIRYFKIAAPTHTADEEISLFPRLPNSDDPAAAEARRVLERLEADHERQTSGTPPLSAS
jgi:hypothetical protein